MFSFTGMTLSRLWGFGFWFLVPGFEFLVSRLVSESEI